MKKVDTEKQVNVSVPERTEASKIWAEIKDKKMDLFALPGKVSDFCTYQDVEPSKCYLVLKAGAALSALEEVLSATFKVELVDKWATVSRKK